MSNLLGFFTPDESDSPSIFWAKEMLLAVLVVALFYGLSRLLRRVLLHLVRRLSQSKLDGRVLERSIPSLCLLVNVTGLYFGATILPLPAKMQLVASGALFVAIVLVLANTAIRVSDEMLLRYGDRMAGAEMSRQLIPLVQKVASIFLIGTALIITLKHFNYDILSLVTALGVGSLAIGLAAKDTLANMISGFTLMIDRPFRIGDAIQVGSQASHAGEVVDIGLRSTKIKAADSTYLIIPNSELCNSTLINLAFPDNRVKGRINVGGAYDADLGQVKELLVAAARSVPEVLAEPAPEAFLTGFGDSALNYALFFWVGDYRQLFAVTDRINCAIATGFREAGVIIPYPTRTVLLEKDPIHGSQD